MNHWIVVVFYFSWLTSRVLSWSSLDWDRGRWNQMDLVIGTSFDIFTHILNAYCLFEVCDHTLNVMIIHLVVVVMLVIFIMYNPKLAWANANQLEKAPKWVRDRIKPLTKEQSQRWEVVESLGSKLFGWNDWSNLLK